jgi:hypothetical protein
MEADAAALAALGRVFRALDRVNTQTLLLAIGQRPDSVEKVKQFQAVEVLSRRMLEVAQEARRPVGAEWAQLWATMAHAAAGAVWDRLGMTKEYPLAAPDQIDAMVLIDFMNDAELMGILGLEAGWTPDLQRADTELDT